MKSEICNVVCTADLEQMVDIKKLVNLPCGIFDDAIYGGRCGYVKTPEMSGKVTIFSSGKMISVGAKSVKKAKEQLHHAKFYLISENIIGDTKINPVIRNIVAITDLKKNIPVDILSSKIKEAKYNPENFSGLILKDFCDCSFLIFSSGKIVQTRGKSIKQTYDDLQKVISKINSLLN